MKTKISICALLIAMCANAEDLLVDGKSWLCEREYRQLNSELEWVSTTQRYTIEVVKDTIVDKKICKLMLSTMEGETNKIIGYEENGIIYHVFSVWNNPQRNLFLPYLNFNANKGETLQTYYIMDEDCILSPDGYITVTDIKAIKGRKVMTMSNGAQWVEGIGASLGENHWLTDIFYAMPTDPGTWIIDRDEMLECRQDGELIWSSSDFADIRIVAFRKDAQSIIFDLQGRRVVKPIEGHCYIRSSKKFVM